MTDTLRVALEALPRHFRHDDAEMLAHPEGFNGDGWLRYSDVVALLARLAPPAPGGDAVREAAEWARAEFEDKRHVAECRGDAGLADYYARCRDRMDEALAAAPAPAVEREAVGHAGRRALSRILSVLGPSVPSSVTDAGARHEWGRALQIANAALGNGCGGRGCAGCPACRDVEAPPAEAPRDAPAVEREAVATQAEQSDRRTFPMGYDSHLHGLVTDNVASALLCCGIDHLPAGVLDTIASEVVRGYYGATPPAEAREPVGRLSDSDSGRLVFVGAEAREPVGDAELRQQRDAAEQRAATLSRMLEERTFPSVEVTDAMVERGLRWYWPHDMKYADNQRDFMRRFLEAALAQPRDTPRDSGDAKDAEQWLSSTARKAGPHGVSERDESLMRLGYENGYRAAMQSTTGDTP